MKGPGTEGDKDRFFRAFQKTTQAFFLLVGASGSSLLHCQVMQYLRET